MIASASRKRGKPAEQNRPSAALEAPAGANLDESVVVNIQKKLKSPYLPTPGDGGGIMEDILLVARKWLGQRWRRMKMDEMASLMEQTVENETVGENQHKAQMCTRTMLREEATVYVWPAERLRMFGGSHCGIGEEIDRFLIDQHQAPAPTSENSSCYPAPASSQSQILTTDSIFTCRVHFQTEPLSAHHCAAP